MRISLNEVWSKALKWKRKACPTVKVACRKSVQMSGTVFTIVSPKILNLNRIIELEISVFAAMTLYNGKNIC